MKVSLVPCLEDSEQIRPPAALPFRTKVCVAELLILVMLHLILTSMLNHALWLQQAFHTILFEPVHHQAHEIWWLCFAFSSS